MESQGIPNKCCRIHGYQCCWSLLLCLEVKLQQLIVAHLMLCFLGNFLACCQLARRISPVSIWQKVSTQKSAAHLCHSSLLGSSGHPDLLFVVQMLLLKQPLLSPDMDFLPSFPQGTLDSEIIPRLSSEQSLQPVISCRKLFGIIISWLLPNNIWSTAS